MSDETRQLEQKQEGKKPANKKPFYKKGPHNKKPVRTQVDNEQFSHSQNVKTGAPKPVLSKVQEGNPKEQKEKKFYPPKRKNYSPRPQQEAEPVQDENVIFGRNAVLEVLKSDRDIDKILVQKGEVEGSIRKIIGDAKQQGIVVQEVEKAKLDEVCSMEKHQGVVAFVAAKKYVEIDEMLNDAKAKGEDPFIVILDNIQDPHNLGAIIRSAHNAGVHGIIIPKRRAAGLTSTVAKTSAGALEYMKIAKVSNISQTIEDLKKKGIWVACGDMDGEIMYTDNMKGPIGIVIGSEGEGVSKNVKAKCDFVVSIPMYGKVSSLNASVAASLMVYEVVRQRNF
jgi:23S rRNA (guanosine2251-2'-O)-methyltransferase